MAPTTKSPAPKRNLLRLLLRSMTRGMFGVYRPERHYMRGPGPKWREKHQPPPRPENIDMHASKMAI